MSDKDEIDWIKKNEPWRLNKKVIYTEEYVYALSKAEQVKILNSHGITDIPQYEKGRVEKIIEIMIGE